MRNVFDFSAVLGSVLGLGLLAVGQPQYSPVSSQEANRVFGAACAQHAQPAVDVCSGICGWTRIQNIVSGGITKQDDALACGTVTTCTAPQSVSGTCGG